MTLIIDMFSGTGELGRAVAAGLAEPVGPTFRPGSMKATAPLHSTPPFGRTLQASPSLDSRTMKAD